MPTTLDALGGPPMIALGILWLAVVLAGALLVGVPLARDAHHHTTRKDLP